MTRLKAVLFDHDGTLVNSEGVGLALWRKVLPQYNATLSEAEYQHHFVGVPSSQSIAAFVQRHHIAALPQDILAQKHALMHAYLREQAFPLMPGASDAVEVLKSAGLSMAIVTGAGRTEGVLSTLQHYGWAEAFQAVVTADDVPHSKPAPDVYLLAMAQLGVRADEAIAIEDTAAGTRAAVAAGLRCIAIPHELSKHQDFSHATLVMSSMNEAVQWIKNQALAG
jgi:HAD superfamily hydrolase (TIGR01509 family)